MLLKKIIFNRGIQSGDGSMIDKQTETWYDKKGDEDARKIIFKICKCNNATEFQAFDATQKIGIWENLKKEVSALANYAD